MFDQSILLLLLVTAQDTPRTNTDVGRAKRAAIVDRIMDEPAPPRANRPAPVEAPVERPAPQIARVVKIQNQKHMTLELKEIAPAEQEADGEDQQPVQRMRPINLNEMSLARDNFDRWVFGEGVDEEKRRGHLHSLLSGKISSLEKMREINAEQSERLRLAGSGDIKRFFDRVEERRSDFEVARREFNTGRIALGQLEPLSTEYQAGPFGNDSFFAKTLRKIESDAGAARPGEK